MKELEKRAVFSLILALSLMGCDSPANSVFVIDAEQEKETASQAASLFPVPVRREYLESAAFAKTEEHLSVFAVYSNGNAWKIPLDQTEVMIEQTLLDGDAPYHFASAGEKEVAVRYGSLSARYAIIVRSSTENPGGTNPAPPSGGTSVDIEIKWK